MGYGSQDGYDWMMDTYSPSNTWWMPEGLNFDGSLSGGGFDFQEFETDLGNMGITETENLGYGGFSLGFDEVNAIFEVLDKDIFTDAFTVEDKSYLNSIGIDSDKLVSDAFGEDGLLDLSQNGEITPDANPSVTRQKILDIYSDPKNLGEAEVYLRTFVKELDYLQHKRASDNIQNTVSRAHGFSNAEIREINQAADLEDFRNRFDVALQDFVDSDYYDGRFNNPNIIDERQTIILDESMGYTPSTTGYGDVVDNPDYGKYIVDQDLINDFAYGVDKITEDDVNDSVNKIDLSFGQNTGETISSSGYFVAIALDLLGMSGVGTSLYVTQAGYNYVVNGIERIANKLTGLGFDFPNLNIHEMAAEILNQKFVDKDGEPILEGIADKTKYLMPFHNPEATLSLAGMGGTQLGKFDPTGENIFENIADALLEGNILDAVQEQSEEGKFEGVESNRRTGAIGMLDSISSYVQGLGVAGQKIFGPGLTQMIIDNAIFRGYPVSGLANGISAAMGPQSAKDWVRYLENKGIDPNNVQEADISYWRSALDNYFEDDSVSEPGKTGFDVLLDSANKGGLSAKYLSSLSSYLEEITNKPMDRMQPAEIIAVLNDQVQSSINRGEKYDPENGLDVLYKQLGGTFEVNDKVGFGENNEFYFDLETIDRLKEAFPNITESEYEAGFDYLISEGAEGTQFTEGVDFETTSDASFYAVNYVEEGDYITMPDQPVVASAFEYRTNEQGDDFVYDPMSGVTYGFEQARLSDLPGTRDDLYTFPSLTVEALLSSDRTINKEILKELAFTGKIEYADLKEYVSANPRDFGVQATQDAIQALDAEVGDYYLKKYAGFEQEDLDLFVLPDTIVLSGANFFSNSPGDRAQKAADFATMNQSYAAMFGEDYFAVPSLENILIAGGFTDENFNVLPSNNVYKEDFTQDSVFELRPFTVVAEENGVPTVVRDNVYGFEEDYDPNRYNENTGEYLFREYSFNELKYVPRVVDYSQGVTSMTPAKAKQPLIDRDSRHKILKSLLEQGEITEAEATAIDKSYFIGSDFNIGTVDRYDGNAETIIGMTLEQKEGEWRDSSPFYNASNEPSYINSFEYESIEDIDLDAVDGTDLSGATQFYDIGEFTVIEYDNSTDLNNAYQDRLDAIDESGFDFQTREFLKDSAYNLFASREAFLNLDSTSQQLILDAQAEATSDFVDLGVFTVTGSNARALNAQLTARMNIINAADLSEGQKQYEIDLANAIYNSKISEINTLTYKNIAITTAENARDAAIQREGAASQTATDLQARIDKIEDYEIPEFNVTAYLNAEDSGAYMQNFVNEVIKGTTEEFGNFLSASNADQILANVAALAQSETDLGIAETAQKDNYDNYQKYLGLYNTANDALTTANETLEANKLTIADLEASKYIELDNFEVTATDIQGAQGQLNDFNTEIDRMVSEGEITSEQGDLEKSLAGNTFDVYKATQDIASLQTSTDTTITGLQADLKTAQDSAASFEAQATEFEGKYNTTKADLEANQAYVLPDFNVFSAMETMGYVYSNEKNYFENPLGLEQVSARDAWVEDYEQQLIDDGILTQEQITNVVNDVERAIFARQSRAFWKSESKKHEGDLSEAQSRIGELETYTLPDFTVEGVAAEDLDGTLSAYQTALDNDLNAELINQEQYNALYNSASELVLGQKAFNDANADAAQSEETLNNKYNELQAQYTDYELPDMRVTGGDFVADLKSVDYYSENIDLEGAYGDVWRMPDVPAEWTGTDYEYRKSLREQLVSMKREEFYDAEGNSVLTESQIDDLMDDYRYAVEYWQSREAWLYNSINKTAQYNTLKTDTDETIRGLREDVEGLQTFSLPEFNITATNQAALDAYLDGYQNYVDAAEKAGNISAEQALNFDTIIASIRNNGTQIFTLEAANADKQNEIDGLKNENAGLSTTIGEKEEDILNLTGTISVIGSGFDVTLYDDIIDLDTGLESYIQGINDSDLDEEMKASQIAFAQSMAEMRRENLYVPTYEAPDFNVIAEGDLTGLNTSYEQAMFTLDSFLDNEYITQEEYDANVADLNTAYNTRKDVIIPAYELPKFTVSELDAEGGFTNLDAEKEEFLNELQGFLDNDYITREEHDALEAQIESAYDTKKQDITPVYEAPDFTVYDTKLEPGEDFSAIDADYNTARDALDLNAQLGYITASEYIDELSTLESSYNEARKGIAPVYELPDFSVYGDLQEGDDFTEIDTAYQNELTRIDEYYNSGYLSTTEYYEALGNLETEYTTRKGSILPTYTMPDFSVTPATSLANLAEIEQAARDRFEMFSDQGYFPEDFDILTEQGNLESLFDAERARLQGTYTLPEFAVEDTKGLLKQEDISNLFSEYEEGLQGDVLEGMLGLDDFFDAMGTAKGTFDIEYGKRKPIQPREGGYQIIPDANNEGDAGQPSTGDFLDYVDDGNYADQYGTIGGIDTSGILTGNYMAKLDPAYQLAEMLLGEAGARDLFPTGKSRGLADEQFQDVVNQFMLGQADDAFDMQAGLAGKQQDLTDQLTRLKRQSDLDLMAEFGDPYRKQIEDLYPGATEALQAQQEIARRSADRARGDLSPSEQSALEQSSYLFGAGRGREYDPFTLANQISEESQVRQQRDTQASNQQIAAMNAERGLYGDLMSIIGTDSPYGAGAGQVTTPFNIGGIMDLGTVDYANQQRLQEAQMAVNSLQRDYDTAVAMREPSKAQSILNDLNQAKQVVEGISVGLSTAQQAFGTVKDIFGGITNIFGGGRSGINTNSFNTNAPSSVDYGDKDSFSRYLFGMGL